MKKGLKKQICGFEKDAELEKKIARRVKIRKKKLIFLRHNEWVWRIWHSQHIVKTRGTEVSNK